MPDAGPDRLSPTAQEADRQLQRLADRLRVVGPRLAGRGTPQAGATLDLVRDGLQRLADLAADADGLPRRQVQRLGAHALGDQALVLGHDLLRGRDDRFRTLAVQAIEGVYALV